jgi:uncharacterized repeat protein (TIGR01451 family)
VLQLFGQGVALTAEGFPALRKLPSVDLLSLLCPFTREDLYLVQHLTKNSNPMKNIYAVLSCFLFLLSVKESKSQYVNIPDTNFVNWLNNNGYSGCMSGNMMDTTCSLIVNAQSVMLPQFGGYVMDLTGIQFFDSLKTLDCSHQALTFLPQLPATLRYLNIKQSNYITTVVLPPMLDTLLCRDNNLLNITSFPSTLRYIDISWCSQTSLPSLPDSLRYLNCAQNNLTSLPVLPQAITFIDCSENDITSLPALPSSLQELYCHHNQIASLPSLSSLVSLYCNNNPTLASLPALPASLENLSCGGTLISTIPTLPSGLKLLACGGMGITVLPGLPSSLTSLACVSSGITALPVLPASLQNLTCYSNGFLTSLPILPPNLRGLNCSDCPITSLPSLPDSLQALMCADCQLTYLPPLPSQLSDFSCYNNQVTWLPQWPDSMHTVTIANNPISCLPRIGYIWDFHFDNTNIHCKPNFAHIQMSSPSYNALPLCQPSDTCVYSWNISGTVYFDNNGNCTQETNDSVLTNVPVMLDSGSVHLQRMLTDRFGTYAFQAGMGTYQITVDTANAPFVVVCPGSFSHTSVLDLSDSLDTSMDFGLQCDAGYDLIARSISPAGHLRPAAIRTLYLNAGDNMMINNVSCAVGVSGTVQAIWSGPVTYLNYLGLAPASVSGDTITWSVADFSLVNPATAFNIEIQVDTFALIGDTVCIQLYIFPATDNIPANNNLSQCFPVVNSLDPNEKYMDPSGQVDTSSQWFTFTVYFQNTGTAEAEQIHIIDTLDNNLDASTFTWLSSSHNVVTQLLPGNILRFNYPNINLPDSVSNEIGSHGYVQYKVERKNGLPIGSVISNTAYIYFDFNPAIVTNTTQAIPSNTIGIYEVTASLKVIIAPNPTLNTFTVSLNEMNAGTAELKMYDVTGREVYITTLNSKFQTLNPNLSNGIYFVRVEMGEKVYQQKLVVE